VVVLSACETGLGKVDPGDGAMGMSWCLFVAGPPTTVVSQWRVGAAGTAKLMIAFHRALWTAMTERREPPAKTTALLHPIRSYRLVKSRKDEIEINKAQVLRQAALMLMHQPKYAHPFYWAAFVVVGDGF